MPKVPSTSSRFSKAEPLVPNREIIYLNYSPRCPICISNIRDAASLAFDTDDYTPKDLGHSEHRDNDQDSDSTDSEAGYIPRESNGNWRIEVMNKYNIGLRRVRAPRTSAKRTHRLAPAQGFVSDSGIGSSLGPGSPARGPGSPARGPGPPRISNSASGSTPGVSASGLGSPVSKAFARVLKNPSVSSPGSSSKPAGIMGLGELLLAPLASIRGTQGDLSKKEIARLNKLEGESRLGFFGQFPEEEEE